MHEHKFRRKIQTGHKELCQGNQELTVEPASRSRAELQNKQGVLEMEASTRSRSRRYDLQIEELRGKTQALPVETHIRTSKKLPLPAHFGEGTHQTWVMGSVITPWRSSKHSLASELSNCDKAFPARGKHIFEDLGFCCPKSSNLVDLCCVRT
ncbi:hypothetical protein LEMLEM_LOCUS1935 [Lemmus lemmus]